jgi:hypothetical protein
VPIIQADIKAPRQRNDKFLQPFVSMASTNFSAWDIIDPISPFDGKRNLALTLNESQVSSNINYPGQNNESAIIDYGWLVGGSSHSRFRSKPN